MTDPSRTIASRRRHTRVPLGLAAAVLALAIGGSIGHPSGALDPPPAAPSASPPIQSAPSAGSASGNPGSLHAFATPRPAETPYLRGSSETPQPTPTPFLSRPSGPAATPDTARRDTPALDPPPKPGRFAIDLFDEGDFVSQARADWCVPASTLTIMNMIDLEGDQTTPTQHELDRLARSLSTERLTGAGSEPEGWAGSLNQLGYGPYEVRAERTRTAAIKAAARAIRLTGRPVGLLVWRGAHAWVMSGFRATADPAYTDDFEVTHLYVADSWYPRVSSIWGPAQPPDALVPVRRMAGDYLAWRRPAVRYPEKDGRFVLVAPVAESPSTS